MFRLPSGSSSSIARLANLPSPFPRRSQKAFSLTEILVVVSVIALLAMLALPAFKKATARRNAIVCLSNLRQVYLDLITYSQNNDYLYPPLTATDSKGNTLYWMDSVSLSVYGDNTKRMHQGCPAFRNYLQLRYFDRTYSLNATLIKYTNPKTFALTTANQTMLVAEGAITNNKYNYYMYAGTTDLAPYPMHDGAANIVFADGHIETRKKADIPTTPGATGTIPHIFWYGN